MKCSELGMGLIDLLLTAAVLIGLVFLVLHRERTQNADPSTAKALADQGVALPSGASLNNVKAAEKAVTDQLDQAQKAADERLKAASCAAGASTQCSKP